MRIATFALSAVVLVGHASAQDAIELSASGPNHFVSYVQQQLLGKGVYSGEVNGQLTQETISAINRACRSAGLLRRCQLGPLTPVGSKAVLDAIQSSSSRAASTAESASSNVLGEVGKMQAKLDQVDWKRQTSGNGLSIMLQGEIGKSTAEVTGTADKTTYINLSSQKRWEATAGQRWTFSVEAAAELSKGATASLRIAAFDKDRAYLGELASNQFIQAGTPMRYEVSGVAPEGAMEVAPYVQLNYPSDTQANDELYLTNPTFQIR